MKKIGNLYGCDLLLDTDDEKRAELAEKWFEYLVSRDKALGQIEVEKEVENFVKTYSP